MRPTAESDHDRFVSLAEGLRVPQSAPPWKMIVFIGWTPRSASIGFPRISRVRVPLIGRSADVCAIQMSRFRFCGSVWRGMENAA